MSANPHFSKTFGGSKLQWLHNLPIYNISTYVQTDLQNKRTQPIFLSSYDQATLSQCFFGRWLFARVTAVAPNISGKYLFLIFLTYLDIRIEKPFIFQLQNSKYGKCQVMNNILKFVSPIYQKENKIRAPLL